MKRGSRWGGFGVFWIRKSHLISAFLILTLYKSRKSVEKYLAHHFITGFTVEGVDARL